MKMMSKKEMMMMRSIIIGAKAHVLLSIPIVLALAVFSNNTRIKMIAIIIFCINTLTAIRASEASRRFNNYKNRAQRMEEFL